MQERPLLSPAKPEFVDTNAAAFWGTIECHARKIFLKA